MIKAIETEYNGYKFRSRLEARFAVFFDNLSIPWEYEKEGYDLDGTWYLPDFWLPRQDCWIEIKGQNPTEEEREKARKLVLETRKNVFILYGTLEPYSCYMKVIDNNPVDFVSTGAMGDAFLYRECNQDVYFSDGFYLFGECSHCHNIVISHWGRSSDYNASLRECSWLLGSKNMCDCQVATFDDFSSPYLIDAYKAARQACFEHRKQ